MTSSITLTFFLKVLLIVGVSWLPVHICKEALKRFYPTEEKKIMMVDNKIKDVICIIFGVILFCLIIYLLMNE